MVQDSRVKTERNRVNKLKSLKKKKTWNWRKKKLIGPPFEVIQKLLLKNLCNRKMYTYILLVDDEVVMQSVPSTNKLVSANHRTNYSYSRSSFTRSIDAESRCSEQKIRRSNPVLKRLEKRKWIHQSCQLMISVDGLCYMG